jgi:A/G-specific adenine glycosylase
VIPYYHRFLSLFPTVKALAAARLQEVLKAWENLGYYTRARHLHAAAKKIMDHLDGEIPRSMEELIGLPGIGSYTAAAIMSIAYGERMPAVDGNVRRVFCRLFFIQDAIDQRRTQRHVHQLVEERVPQKAPGAFNQGIMDLGATICTPRRPSCSICPLQNFCRAFRQGCQEALPVRRKRQPLPHKEVTAGIITDGLDRLLIVQRPGKGLLGGLWKFPGGMKEPEETLQQALRRSIHDEVGIRVRAKKGFISVKHAYTHFRITLHAYRCSHWSGQPRALGCPRCCWAELQSLSDFPFSKADRKIINALEPQNLVSA